MKQLIKKGVEILHRADDKLEYKPFVIFRENFFFFTKNVTYHIIRAGNGYMLYSNYPDYEPTFLREEEGLKILNDLIYRELEWEKNRKDSKIIKKEIKYINE